jgi:pectate lyase
MQRPHTRRWLRNRALVSYSFGFGILFGSIATAQQPAFPGAEGFGAYATGGRSGTVYHVTNLNNSGSGSFHDAVSQPNRTVVFDVSGIINVPSNAPLAIAQSNITVAGQTAPGDGVTLKGGLTSVENTRNVIVRFLHCRPGDVNCPNFQEDSFHVYRGSNVIADHISGAWCNDEVLSVTSSTNVTIQWCMITEPLNHSCHDEGSGVQDHGYGSLLRYGAGGVTYHHNLYAHCLSRNPRLGDSIHLDFVNNVVFNWGSQAGYNASDGADNPNGYTNWMNSVCNFFIAGTNTSSSKRGNIFNSGVPTASFCQIYQSGNNMDTNFNHVFEGSDRGWAAFTGTFTMNATRFAFPPVTTDTASNAYVRVLSGVGASVARDAVDARIVSNVMSQTGKIINSQNEVGGWPTVNSLPAPTDTDQDGMPDYWEQALGLDPNNAADGNALTADGYTRLEGYLNWLAGPHAHATNTFVDVELRQYTAGLTNPTFAVFSPTNGTVALLGDGHTAEFIPNTGFSGLGSFLFAAAGSAGQLTGTVSVLATAPTGSELTPFQQWQVDYFTSTDNPSADPEADPDGDGQNNLAEFLSGTVPTNQLSVLRITSAVRQGDDVAITWTTAGGHTNAVQTASSDENGGYTSNFVDVTSPPHIIVTGTGDATTNYVDIEGATNAASRFYRIRLVP